LKYFSFLTRVPNSNCSRGSSKLWWHWLPWNFCQTGWPWSSVFHQFNHIYEQFGWR